LVPLLAQAPFPPSFVAHRADPVVTPEAVHATHLLPWQSGAPALVQSVSEPHSTQAPGLPRQKRVVPVPEHGAPVPHRHPRFVQVFASVALQPEPHEAHDATLVPMHPGTPEVSQQRLEVEQPPLSEGSHAAHWPFFVPLMAQTGAVLDLLAQRASARANASKLVSHATHTSLSQNGFPAVLQSVSTAHSPQRPVFVSQTFPEATFTQSAFEPHAWHE
jgi:hypothetical protein